MNMHFILIICALSQPNWETKILVQNAIISLCLGIAVTLSFALLCKNVQLLLVKLLKSVNEEHLLIST